MAKQPGKTLATQKKTVKELTEAELEKKQIELMKKREANCVEEVNALLKKHNCVLVTNVNVVLNGQKVIPMLKALK